MVAKLRRSVRLWVGYLAFVTSFLWTLAALPVFMPGVQAADRQPLRVALDDNYPPYIFRDAEGRLRGILVDRWALWEKATGRSVQLLAMDWAKAQEVFRQGQADLLDTVFLTPQRAEVWAFGKAYAEIPVSVYYHETISGLADVHALKGFAVAVKKGDACIEVLRAKGITNVILYPSYEAIVRDAAAGTVKIFCMDEPPANYFLAKYGAHGSFKKGFTLYSGWLHRAVLQGREDVLHAVEQGFASLDPEALQKIDRRWMGIPLASRIPWRTIVWVLGSVGVVVMAAFGWIVLLRTQVRRRTQEIQRLLSESRKRQEVLRITFESMAEGVIITDKEGFIQDMNPMAEELTGWKAEEARGRPCAEVFRIVNEKTRVPVPDPVAKVLEQGVTVGLANHTVLMARNGTERPIADSAAPMVDLAGQILGCVLVFRDQTEERRTLQLLHEALEKHQLALEAASMSSWDWHVSKRRIVRDAAWAERRGLDAKRVWEDEKAWSETVHPEDRPRVLSCLREHLEGKTPYFEATYRVRTNEGGYVWILDRGKVIERDDAGKPLRMIGIETDITAQKTMEARLRVLTQAVEQSPLSIVITDPSAHIEYVNEQFCRLTGYTPQEVMGQNPRILQSGKTPRETYDALWTALKQGQVWRGVFCNKKKDGTLFWEEATICPIVDEAGRISHYLGLKQDITTTRQLEDQLSQAQKLESIGRLAGGVAHDFNNALQIIMGYAEVALGLVRSEDRVHRMLNEIYKAAQRSAGVVRQLLTFARKEVIRPVPLNLNEHLAETHRMLQRLIGEEIFLELRPGRNLWPVLLDPSQVDQMVANLVINGRDAIQGTGMITLETENVVLDGTRKAGPVHIPKGQYVRLTVSDTGCGMDAQTLERIFEPFFTTKEVGKGTGLGLSTVYGIVKQNHGWIDVESIPGRGTRFDLFFPRLIVDDEGHRAESGPSPEEELQGAGETVLLVEDEPAVLELAQSVLENGGYRVHAFSEPQAALQWAEKTSDPVHLLLTDVIMPQMSGRELWDQLKTWHPEAACLFMSGYTADILVHRGVGGEDSFFISKPFTAQALLWKVREVLGAEPNHRSTPSPKK
ncbi:PAS domain S-box protein [Desulfosoma caldarium]|uniref:histidine kinase n=1 Tax=Desulfosoma caldarium TaxID=610254 RepID=A0A3N1VQF9_9BACT|nr:PAS domain S-box protein [Desulfosoma caldarium]ROR03301.1 PAS domain S-box-containing protein [Desulfosoma caldarium]